MSTGVGTLVKSISGEVEMSGRRRGGGGGNFDKIKRKGLFVNETQFYH